MQPARAQPISRDVLRDKYAHAGEATCDGVLRRMSHALAMRLGGGVGFDFSRIRPRGAGVGAARLPAAWPLAFMHVFDASCRALTSGAFRRGARMAVLRCDHPDIEAFATAKAGDELRRQPRGRHDRRVHASARRRWRSRARSRRAARARADASRRRAAQRRALGLSPHARPRAVGAHRALGARPRRARSVVPGPHQGRQQPRLLRDHRRDEPLRRAAAAALRELLPRFAGARARRVPVVRRGGPAARRRLRIAAAAAAGAFAGTACAIRTCSRSHRRAA